MQLARSEIAVTGFALLRIILHGRIPHKAPVREALFGGFGTVFYAKHLATKGRKGDSICIAVLGICSGQVKAYNRTSIA